MKSQNIIALLLFVFVFSACEKDELLQQEVGTEANQIIQKADKEVPSIYRISNVDETAQESAKLARNLQWVAYLSARVLRNYPSARQEIITHSGASGIYDLNTLLDEDGVYQNFQQEFRDQVYSYVYGRPDQENEPDRPLGNGGNGLTPEQQIIDFIDYILNEQCIELYIPNGITSLSLEYSSTGHPLDTSASNFGYRRLATEINNDGDIIRVVEEENIDDTYVQSHPNVIIARPDRWTGMGTIGMNPDPNCYYNEYSVDFDLFLDQ